MPDITHTSNVGQRFACAAGDNTVKALLAAANIPIFDGVKKVKVVAQNTGPIGVAYRATAMTAVTDGLSLAVAGDNKVWEMNVQRMGDILDLGKVHIFTGDANQTPYIEIIGF